MVAHIGTAATHTGTTKERRPRERQTGSGAVPTGMLAAGARQCTESVRGAISCGKGNSCGFGASCGRLVSDNAGGRFGGGGGGAVSGRPAVNTTEQHAPLPMQRLSLSTTGELLLGHAWAPPPPETSHGAKPVEPVKTVARLVPTSSTFEELDQLSTLLRKRAELSNAPRPSTAAAARYETHPTG